MLKIIGDFRCLCLALFFSYIYWLFFTVPDWFIKQFYLSLSILILGCVFSKQRFFFGILLFLCLIFQAKYFWSPNTVFHSSHKLKQECGQKADFIEAHFNKRVENYLWLSKGIIGCGKKRFFFASETLRIPKYRFIGVYPNQKIKITQVKLDQDNSHHSKHTDLSDAFDLNLKISLHSRFTRIKTKNSSKYWQDWKSKASDYLDNAAKPLYLGIALADRSDLPRTLRQELQYLGIFHLFAISGLHIGMIFLLFRFLFAKLLASSIILLHFFSLKFKGLLNQVNVYFYADWAAVSLLWFYLDFINNPLTAIRAWTMLLIWVFMHYFVSWIPTNYVLLLIAVSMLLIEPNLITSVSFLLSFLSVFAILVYLKLFAYKEKKITPIKGIGLKTIVFFMWKNRITQSLTKIIAVSFFINLFILPIFLFYFAQNNLGFAKNSLLSYFFFFVCKENKTHRSYKVRFY